MITSIRLNDFKNFVNEKLGIGSFTATVGANASGKSNARNAFRFLHGVGRGYAFAEILGGKFGSGGQNYWRWSEVRAEIRVKERYFDRLAGERGMAGGPDEGRRVLGREAARRVDAIRRKCPEGFDDSARCLQAVA